MRTLLCKGVIKNNYPLYISKSKNISEFFSFLPYSKKRFIIYDRIIEKNFNSILAKFSTKGDYLFPVIAKEKNKSFENLRNLLRKIFTLKPSRDDYFVMIGGGLILNFGGLAASLTMRGMNFYYIPTTLTAQIDASFGSKQAVNFYDAKNWIGIFNDPEFCYINPNFLYFINERELKSQWIEGIKLCLALDKKLFNLVYLNLDNFFLNRKKILNLLLEEMIKLKIKMIDVDLKEEGIGMSMLYGHTIGHAIEMLSKGVLNHGESVGLGMVCAAKISYKLGIASENLVTIHQNILEKLKLPTKIPSFINPKKIIKHLCYNKKNYGDNVRFFLLKNVGEPYNPPTGKYYHYVPNKLLSQIVKSCF